MPTDGAAADPDTTATAAGAHMVPLTQPASLDAAIRAPGGLAQRPLDDLAGRVARKLLDQEHL